MSSSLEDGQKMRGSVVPWMEPSAFEIAAMAKLKTMVSKEVYDALERAREMTGMGMLAGPDPEVLKLCEQIRQDRIDVLTQAIYDGKLNRRGQT